jgi:hypothetical protein
MIMMHAPMDHHGFVVHDILPDLIENKFVCLSDYLKARTEIETTRMNIIELKDVILTD